MTINNIAEIFSLWLTTPFVYLALYVMRDWMPHFKDWLSKHRTSLSWFGAGVFISFFGQAGDNTYWFGAWASHFLELTFSRILFENGVFANIPFRQIAGWLSAYLHIRGLYAMIEEMGGFSTVKKIARLHLHIMFSFLLSTVIIALFIWEKYG